MGKKVSFSMEIYLTYAIVEICIAIIIIEIA